MGHFEKCVLAARRGAVPGAVCCRQLFGNFNHAMHCAVGSSESIMVGRESKKKLYQDDRG